MTRTITNIKILSVSAAFLLAGTAFAQTSTSGAGGTSGTGTSGAPGSSTSSATGSGSTGAAGTGTSGANLSGTGTSGAFSTDQIIQRMDTDRDGKVSRTVGSPGTELEFAL